MERRFKVLLIGSGMMTGPLVDHLISFNDTTMTIASNLLEDAQKIASKNPSKLKAIYLDIFNQAGVDQVVSEHDIVVSFVPPSLHMPVAKACLKNKKHMVTSSYISKEMEGIHD